MQHLARQRRKTPFSMRGWQARASLCNTLFMTRNETLGQRFESARRLSFFSCFSVNLREETDLYTLNGKLVGMVRETMQPSHIPL